MNVAVKCKESWIYAFDMSAAGVRSAVCRELPGLTESYVFRQANFSMHGSLKIHTVISRNDLHNATTNLAITRGGIRRNC